MKDKKYDDYFDEKTDGQTPEQELLDIIVSKDTIDGKELESGKKVKGSVIKIGPDFVYIDINHRNEALMKREECIDSEGNLTVKEGDKIEAFVTSVSNSEIMVSKSLSARTVVLHELVDAMKNKIPISGKITGINKGGFNVSILGKRAFCPISHIDIKHVEDPNPYLLKTLDFVITNIEQKGANIVVSRLPLLELTLVKLLDEVEKEIPSKKLYRGTITKISPFGLFVSLGDLDGLVHISEVSWDRAENLENTYKIGDTVEYIVLKIERKEPLRTSKISLSIRQASENPWTDITKKISVGSSMAGTITRLTNFGAFVQLLPGIEGLIHVSEMTWGKRVKHPSDVVKEGDNVTVSILGVDETKHSVSCSLKDTSQDPWINLHEKCPVGAMIKGVVVNETRFGFFVELFDGVTALLPHGKIENSKKGSIKKGETIEVFVEGLDYENRKITLAYGQNNSAEADTTTVSKYVNQPKKAEQGKGSTEFGAMLLQAMKGKNQG